MRNLWKFYNNTIELYQGRLYWCNCDFFYVVMKEHAEPDVVHLNSGVLLEDWDTFVPTDKFPTLTSLAGSIVRYLRPNSAHYVHYTSLVAVQLYSLQAMFNIMKNVEADWWEQCYDAIKAIYAESGYVDNTTVPKALNYIHDADIVMRCLISVCKPESYASAEQPLYTGFENQNHKLHILSGKDGNSCCMLISDYKVYFDAAGEHMFERYDNEKEPSDYYESYVGDVIKFLQDMFRRTLTTDELKKKGLHQYSTCVFDTVWSSPLWDLIENDGR